MAGQRAIAAAWGLALAMACCNSGRHGGTGTSGSGESNEPDEPPLLAGGETSEFSGGSQNPNYCATELSRTALDPQSAEIAPWLAPAAGHHELPLRWTREFPDPAIRGFEERTQLSMDVSVIGVEDVLCGPNSNGNSENHSVRRFQLAVDLTSEDGALHTSFQRPFFPHAEAQDPRRQWLEMQEWLPYDQVDGTLDLGLEPDIAVQEQVLSVNLSFSERALAGTLAPVARLRQIGAENWAPVTGEFPAPDEGCYLGHSVDLDTPIDILGRTPRAAFEAARAHIPGEPMAALWNDTPEPGHFTRTQITMRVAEPTAACASDDLVQVYGSWQLESADGRLRAATPMITVLLPGVDPSHPGGSFGMDSPGHMLDMADLQAQLTLPDVDLGGAKYAGLYLEQNWYGGPDLEGSMQLGAWANHVGHDVEGASLQWCAGPDCERHWCALYQQDMFCQ